MQINHYRRLRDLREDNDYTQRDIGNVLGISAQQYQLYESGQRDLPTPFLIALANLYHTTTDYILERTEE